MVTKCDCWQNVIEISIRQRVTETIDEAMGPIDKKLFWAFPRGSASCAGRLLVIT